MVDANGRRHAARHAAAGLLERRDLPRIRRQNRGRTRQALRQRPARLGLAARQRTQPLRQGTVLLRRLPGEVPRVAEEKIRHDRRAEPRLGQRLLVADVPELRPDPPPEPRRNWSRRSTRTRVLDAQRWFADEAADYLRFQTGILRKYCGNRQWITSNFMHDVRRGRTRRCSGKDFEIITWTHLPGARQPERGPARLPPRQRGRDVLRRTTFTAASTALEGIMELQPGQVNWGEVNPQPYPGAVHLWLMRAFAAGAKLVCTYRYREPLFGAEQYHYGLVGTDGVTPTTGGEQYSQAAREMALLRAAISSPTRRARRLRRAPHRAALQRREPLGHRQSQADHPLGHVRPHAEAVSRAQAPRLPRWT